MDKPEAHVPEYFLIKLQVDKRRHYIFCEMVASCNYSLDGAPLGGEREPPLLPIEALEELLRTQRELNAHIEIEDCVVLSEPGDGRGSWTVRSAKAQSGKQSGR